MGLAGTEFHPAWYETQLDHLSKQSRRDGWKRLEQELVDEILGCGPALRAKTVAAYRDSIPERGFVPKAKPHSTASAESISVQS